MPHIFDPTFTPLLIKACHTLSLTQKQLGDLCGVSLRTAHRWSQGRTYPSSSEVQRLARAAFSVDPQLAAALAREAGTTLVEWGIVSPPSNAPPPPPPRAYPPIALMVDSIVMAAVDAADTQPAGPGSPHAVRARLRAAFSRARGLGLTVQEVDDALAPPTSSKPAPSKK